MYDYVYVQDYYYVGSRYKQAPYSYVSMGGNKYYASSIADGRVTSVTLKLGYNNQVYIKGTSGLYMDILKMRMDY